jgi:anti-sigma factor RsiW
MNCRKAHEAFEQLIDGDISLQSFPELEEHLKQCPACQDWYRRERRIIQGLERMAAFPAPDGFARQILDRLPDLSLGALEQVVRVIVRAWEEPGFRETLRSAPAQTLQDEGVELPPDLKVVVVPPGESALPTRQLLALPLPAAGEGPLSAENLRARLHSSTAAVLVAPEMAFDPATPKRIGIVDRFDAVPTQARQAWRSFLSGLTHPAPRRMLAPALVMVASLLLVLGVVYVLVGDQVPSTPGAATGTWSWALGGLFLVILGLVVVLLLWRRKR